MIFIKRYGMPLFLAVGLYTVIYFIFGYGKYYYFDMGLFMSVIMAYLIRICDDICDYEADRARNRAPIPKKALIVACIAIATVMLALSLIFKAYFMLIAIFLILIQFAIRDKYRSIIKPLFMPTIAVALVFAFFKPDWRLILVASVLIIFDVILILLKGRREK